MSSLQARAYGVPYVRREQFKWEYSVLISRDFEMDVGSWNMKRL